MAASEVLTVIGDRLRAALDDGGWHRFTDLTRTGPNGREGTWTPHDIIRQRDQRHDAPRTYSSSSPGYFEHERS